MRLLDLDEVKGIELSLLIKFDKLAKEHDLWYSLAYGTLIGAVRHKGFIPWDDDIDVMMPRKDYDKLITILEKQEDVEFRVIENGSSNHPFLKIIDASTHIDTKYAEASEVANLWIDVFPIDDLPNSEKKSRREFRYVNLLKVCFGLSCARIGTGTTWYKRILKAPLCILPKLLGTKFWGNRINEFCKKSRELSSEYCGVFCWGYGYRERMKKELYSQRVKVQFEGREYWALGGWHEYLTNLYGDYMQLPPAEKRVTHNMKAWLVEDEDEK